MQNCKLCFFSPSLSAHESTLHWILKSSFWNVLTYLQIRHNCLTYFLLFQSAPYLLLHSAMCQLSSDTSGRSAHVVTNGKPFHVQGTLHGLLGCD
jgi:hypothetical protein